MIYTLPEALYRYRYELFGAEMPETAHYFYVAVCPVLKRSRRLCEVVLPLRLILRVDLEYNREYSYHFI